MEKPRILLNTQDRHLLCDGFLFGANFLGQPLYQSAISLKEKLPHRQEIKLNCSENLDVLSLNLFNIWRLYRKTQQTCTKEETLNLVQTHLESYLPHVIICHSIGCHLMENYINSGRKLPKETDRIIYCQSDSRTVSLPWIENYYSPLDPILYLSWLVNLSRPVGLQKVKNCHNTNLPPDFARAFRSHLFWPAGLHLDTFNFEMEPASSTLQHHKHTN
jgi:hypothetical protein